MRDPDATEEVLLNRDKAFSTGEGWERFIGPYFRRGLASWPVSVPRRAVEPPRSALSGGWTAGQVDQ